MAQTAIPEKTRVEKLPLLISDVNALALVVISVLVAVLVAVLLEPAESRESLVLSIESAESCESGRLLSESTEGSTESLGELLPGRSWEGAEGIDKPSRESSALELFEPGLPPVLALTGKS